MNTQIQTSPVESLAGGGIGEAAARSPATATIQLGYNYDTTMIQPMIQLISRGFFVQMHGMEDHVLCHGAGGKTVTSQEDPGTSQERTRNGPGTPK